MAKRSRGGGTGKVLKESKLGDQAYLICDTEWLKSLVFSWKNSRPCRLFRANWFLIRSPENTPCTHRTLSFRVHYDSLGGSKKSHISTFVIPAT